MAEWEKHFSASEIGHYRLTYPAGTLDELLPCHGCRVPTPLALLDGRPGTPARREPKATDFNRLECRNCYGPGWSEM